MPRRAWMSISLTRCNHSRQRTGKGVKTMNKELLKAALVRSVRTCAQTAIATIGTATAMGQVNWIIVTEALEEPEASNIKLRIKEQIMVLYMAKLQLNLLKVAVIPGISKFLVESI